MGAIKAIDSKCQGDQELPVIFVTRDAWKLPSTQSPCPSTATSANQELSERLSSIEGELHELKMIVAHHCDGKLENLRYQSFWDSVSSANPMQSGNSQLSGPIAKEF